MQMGSREPAAAGGAANPPTICNRLQRAFQTRPAFRPLRRLTGRSEDGGVPRDAATGAPGGALAVVGSTAAAHGSGPRTPPSPVPLPPPAAPPVTSPVPKAPALAVPSTPPPTPTPPKPAAATKGGQVPAATSTPTTTTVTATISNVAEKRAAAGMPVPAPPSAVTGRTPAPEKKAGVDKAQQTKVKTRVGSRVRKALSSSK